MSGPGRPRTGRAFEHARRVWRAMHARSIPLAEAPPEVQALADPDQVTPEARLFVGGLVALFEQVGLRSRAQYHQTKSNLVAVGAIRRLRRGTGRVAAVWLLAAEPTVERWERHVPRPGNVRRLAQVEREHHARLALFLRDLPAIAPTLAEEMRLAGVRTVGQAVDYLRQLPPARLVGLGPGACLAFVGGPAGHTCGAEAVLPGSHPQSPARLVR